MLGIALYEAQLSRVYATLKGRFRLNLTSQVGAGTVLVREDEQGIDCPVSLFSSKFASYQSSYSVMEKEVFFWCN